MHTEGKDEVKVYHSSREVLKGTEEYANLVKELETHSGFFYIRREREDYILTIHTRALFSGKRGRPERIYVMCRVKAPSPEEAIDRLLKNIEGLEGEETEWGKVEKVKHPEKIEGLLDAMRRVKDMDTTKAKKYLPAINKAVEEEEAVTFEANTEEALILALNVVKTIDRVEVVLHFKNFSHYDVLLRKYVGIFITGKPLSPVGEFKGFFKKYQDEISKNETLDLLHKMDEIAHKVWEKLEKDSKLKFDKDVIEHIQSISQLLQLLPSEPPRNRYTTPAASASGRYSRSYNTPTPGSASLSGRRRKKGVKSTPKPSYGASSMDISRKNGIFETLGKIGILLAAILFIIIIYIFVVPIFSNLIENLIKL